MGGTLATRVRSNNRYADYVASSREESEAMSSLRAERKAVELVERVQSRRELGVL